MALSALRDYIARDFLAAYTAVNELRKFGQTSMLFLAAYTAVNLLAANRACQDYFLAAYTAVNHYLPRER